MSSPALQNATCNGCHSLSRDGSRMVVYSDDDDSDDEYSDVAGSFLNMTPLPNNPATEFTGGITGARVGGQPPGFSAVHPLATSYVTSNGYPCTNGRAGTCGTANSYPAAVPTNGWALYNGTNGAFTNGVTIGPTAERPTMPDWSIDGNHARSTCAAQLRRPVRRSMGCSAPETTTTTSSAGSLLHRALYGQRYLRHTGRISPVQRREQLLPPATRPITPCASSSSIEPSSI